MTRFRIVCEDGSHYTVVASRVVIDDATGFLRFDATAELAFVPVAYFNLAKVRAYFAKGTVDETI